MGFLLALGSAGVAGAEGTQPASKGECEASPRGIQRDNLSPLKLPSGGTGSITLHFTEQSISRD